MNPSQRAMRLVAIADEIDRVRALVEVASMAVSDVPDPIQSNALLALLQIIAEPLKVVSKEPMAEEIKVA